MLLHQLFESDRFATLPAAKFWQATPEDQTRGQWFMIRAESSVCSAPAPDLIRGASSSCICAKILSCPAASQGWYYGPRLYWIAPHPSRPL